jgi:hypothetical protein
LRGLGGAVFFFAALLFTPFLLFVLDTMKRPHLIGDKPAVVRAGV